VVGEGQVRVGACRLRHRLVRDIPSGGAGTGTAVPRSRAGVLDHHVLAESSDNAASRSPSTGRVASSRRTKPCRSPMRAPAATGPPSRGGPASAEQRLHRGRWAAPRSTERTLQRSPDQVSTPSSISVAMYSSM
jgi:hypothetical protein